MIRKDPCVYCGRPGESIDHIQPQCQGGLNRWWNYAAACKSCNSNKGHASVLEFMLIGKRSRHSPKIKHKPMLRKKRQIQVMDMPETWFDPLNLFTQKDGVHAGLRL